MAFLKHRYERKAHTCLTKAIRIRFCVNAKIAARDVDHPSILKHQADGWLFYTAFKFYIHSDLYLISSFVDRTGAICISEYSINHMAFICAESHSLFITKYWF